MARGDEEEIDETSEEGESSKKGKKGKSEDIADVIDDVGEKMKLPSVDISRGKYCANTFPTGSLALDLILGGGWGIGRWNNIMGPSMSGKSTLLYVTMSVAQNFLRVPQEVHDHEGSIDPVYMRLLGVKLSKNKGFYNIPSDVGEHTYRFIRRVLKRMPDVERKELAAPTIIFYIDSLKSMVAEAMDEDDEKNPLGMAARMHRTWMPGVRSLLRRKGASIVSTNQISISPMAYGNPETEPGGNAVQHYPDIRVRLGRHSPPKGKAGVPNGIKIYGGGYIKEDSIWPDGGHDKMVWTAARTLKNRQFAPFQEAELRLNLGRGFDPIYDAFSFLDMTGQVEQHKGQKFELRVDGWKHKAGKKLEWLEFGRVVATPEFRDHMRGQIKDNTAFDMYFAVTIGRSNNDDVKRGKDPLAIYELSTMKDAVEKSKKRHAKKMEKKGKKKRKAA